MSMKNIKMQHINYILGLNIKDMEKLELIKCYLEAGETVQSPLTGYWNGTTTPGQNWCYVNGNGTPNTSGTVNC